MFISEANLLVKLSIGIVLLSQASSTFAQATLTLQSEGIVQGKIAKAHACRNQGGQDQAPGLIISGVPAEAKFIAIVADDPDAVPVAGKTWVHWNWFNIPATPTINLAAGQNPAGDEGRTSRGKGYEGMCPPNGVHTYRFAAFALSDKVDVSGFFGPSAMTVESFENKYKGIIVGSGLITGQY